MSSAKGFDGRLGRWRLGRPAQEKQLEVRTGPSACEHMYDRGSYVVGDTIVIIVDVMLVFVMGKLMVITDTLMKRG